MKYKFLIVLIAVILTAGCASFGSGPSQEETLKAVTMINSGGAVLLIENSGVPFIFDGEILVRRGDMESVWTNLNANGFQISGSRVISLAPVSDQSYAAFAETEEMRVFFKKYVDSSASLAKIRADSGVFYLLLGTEVDDYPQLLGITGF
ncbi:MAG: hypothetical protein HN368_22245 [Spirochaetales bacterium]|jgi:hypothetical protein|nr:hypothetical protein [Spirochaetales bacterium]